MLGIPIENLSDAVFFGDLDKVKEFIQEGVDVDGIYDDSDVTPL